MGKRTPKYAYPKLSIHRIRHYDPASAAKEMSGRIDSDSDDEFPPTRKSSAPNNGNNGGAMTKTTATKRNRRAYGARNAEERKERKRSHREQQRNGGRRGDKEEDGNDENGDKENSKRNGANKSKKRSGNSTKKEVKVQESEESSVSSFEMEFDVKNLDESEDESIEEAVGALNDDAAFNREDEGSFKEDGREDSDDDATVDYFDPSMDHEPNAAKDSTARNKEEESSDDESVQVKRRLFPSSTKKATRVLEDDDDEAEEEYSSSSVFSMGIPEGRRSASTVTTRANTKKKAAAASKELTTFDGVPRNDSTSRRSSVKGKASKAAETEKEYSSDEDTFRLEGRKTAAARGRSKDRKPAEKTSSTVTQKKSTARKSVKANSTLRSDKTPTASTTVTDQKKGASTTTKSSTKVKSKMSDSKKKQAILISRLATTKNSYAREQLRNAVAKLEEEESKSVEKKKNGGGKHKSSKKKEAKDEFHFTCQESDYDDEREDTNVSQYDPTQGDASEYNPTQGDGCDSITPVLVPALRRSSRIKQNSAVITATVSKSARRTHRQSAKDVDQEQEEPSKAKVKKGGRKAKSKKKQEASLENDDAVSSRPMKGKKDKSSKKEVAVDDESEEEEEFLLTQQERERVNDGNCEKECNEKESSVTETVQFFECSNDEASGDGNESDDEESIAGNSFKSKYSFFSQPLTQEPSQAMDDSSRSELQDDVYSNLDKRRTSNREANEALIEVDEEEVKQPVANTVNARTKAKGKNKKQSSSQNGLASNNRGDQQTSTKKKGRSTTARVYMDVTRSIPTDPIAFLSKYDDNQERHSASEQSFESPNAYANNSKKMSSQISLSEEKAAKATTNEAPDEHELIVQSETAKSSKQQKKRSRSDPAPTLTLTLTGEQERAIKRAKSLSTMTEDDKTALEEVGRKRLLCKKYLEQTDSFPLVLPLDEVNTSTS